MTAQDVKTIKHIVVEFYFYWHNMPGTDTNSGFDDWWEKVSNKFNLEIPPPPTLQKIDSETEKLCGHYLWFFKGVLIDPYRIFQVYKIASAPQQHAIKKLLRAGKSKKSLRQDIKEVIITLQRWLVMLDEEENE